MLPMLEIDKHSYYILVYMDNILKLNAGQGSVILYYFDLYKYLTFVFYILAYL